MCVIRPPATFDRNSTSVTDRRTSTGPVAADDHVSQMGVRAAFSQSRPVRTPPGAVGGFSTRVSTAWRLVSGPDRCATQTGSERLHRHRCLSVRMHRRDICSTASIEQLPRVLVSLAGEARAGAGAYPDPANRRADDHDEQSRERRDPLPVWIRSSSLRRPIRSPRDCRIARRERQSSSRLSRVVESQQLASPRRRDCRSGPDCTSGHLSALADTARSSKRWRRSGEIPTAC